MNPQDITRTRKLLGLTQEEFARLFDVHPITVSKWERGVSVPSPYQAGLIEHFERNARDKDKVQEELRRLLVTAGVIAALAFLFAR